MLITVLFPMPRARMTAQNSPNTHSVNKPSLLASLFKKEKKKNHKKTRGSLFLALTLYGCLHVQHLSFLCMLSLELFSSSPFLYTFQFFMCIHLNLPFWGFFTFSFNLLSFLFFDYCVHTVTVQCILLTHSLKEGPCWQLGHSLSPSGCVLSCQKEKLKQYLSSFAFLFFYCGNPEHTEWTLRY